MSFHDKNSPLAVLKWCTRCALRPDSVGPSAFIYTGVALKQTTTLVTGHQDYWVDCKAWLRPTSIFTKKGEGGLDKLWLISTSLCGFLSSIIHKLYPMIPSLLDGWTVSGCVKKQWTECWPKLSAFASPGVQVRVWAGILCVEQVAQWYSTCLWPHLLRTARDLD